MSDGLCILPRPGSLTARLDPRCLLRNSTVRHSRCARYVSARSRSLCRPTLQPLEDRLLPATGYARLNLIADRPGVARFTDPNLINPWGVSVTSEGPFWVSDQG